MLSTEGKTLTIKDDFRLLEIDTLVRSIITGKETYDTLVVIMMERKDLDQVFNRPSMDIFWRKLGQSVVTLIWKSTRTSAPPWLTKYFNNVQILQLDTLVVELPPKFYCGLERLTTSEKMIRYDISTEQHRIRPELNGLLLGCTTLKKFEFNCDVPLEATIVNDLFAELNYTILDMDEVIFECEPVPSWADYHNYYWVIERIEMEFSRSGENRKVIIKPLTIKVELKANHHVCAKNCSVHHQIFKSESVTEFSFQHDTKCFECYKTCFLGCPSIRRFHGFYLDSVLLKVMSQHLTRLNHCTCYYQGVVPLTNEWPSFPDINSVDIRFIDAVTYEGFTKFVKSYPNLTRLTVSIHKEITDDDCAEVVSKYLRNLENLSIVCGDSKLTQTGLELIGNHLKNLKELRINCRESKTVIRNLFDTLPELTSVHNELLTFLERNPPDKSSNLAVDVDEYPITVSNDDNINDALPLELLEEILRFLYKSDVLSCRQVCRYWFDICSSSSRLDRTLDLTNSYLTWKTSPVKLFVNTNFKYNRILINDATSCAKGENLTEFWETITRETKEIRIKGHHPNFINAFESGLTAAHLSQLHHLSFTEVPSFNELLKQDNPEWNSLLTRIDTLTFRESDFTKYHKKIEEFSMSNVKSLNFVQFWNDEVVLELLNRISFPKIQNFKVLPLFFMELPQIFQTKLNFWQVKILCVTKSVDQWSYGDLQLIWMNCSNLQRCGLGQEEDTGDDHFDDTVFMRSEQVSRLMFDKLSELSGIYFVKFVKNDGEKFQYKAYCRSGVKSFKKLNKTHRLSDEICCLFEQVRHPM